MITPDDINSLFAEKKPVDDDEDEEDDEEDVDELALTGEEHIRHLQSLLSTYLTASHSNSVPHTWLFNTSKLTF